MTPHSGRRVGDKDAPPPMSSQCSSSSPTSTLIGPAHQIKWHGGTSPRHPLLMVPWQPAYCAGQGGRGGDGYIASGQLEDEPFSSPCRTSNKSTGWQNGESQMADAFVSTLRSNEKLSRPTPKFVPPQMVQPWRGCIYQLDQALYSCSIPIGHLPRMALHKSTPDTQQ